MWNCQESNLAHRHVPMISCTRGCIASMIPSTCKIHVSDIFEQAVQCGFVAPMICQNLSVTQAAFNSAAVEHQSFFLFLAPSVFHQRNSRCPCLSVLLRLGSVRSVTCMIITRYLVTKRSLYPCSSTKDLGY